LSKPKHTVTPFMYIRLLIPLLAKADEDVANITLFFKKCKILLKIYQVHFQWNL